MLFFNIDFFRFWPRFCSLLGLQVRRAACSARRAKSLQYEKTPDVQKLQFFLGFCMFFTHRKLYALATKHCKIVPRACRTELPTKIVLKTRLGMDSKRVWRSLGRHLAGFCPLLGSSWPLLDASWASLGHFLDALGCLLAGLGSFRAAF